jgi:hypothetical protein
MADCHIPGNGSHISGALEKKLSMQTGRKIYTDVTVYFNGKSDWSVPGRLKLEVPGDCIWNSGPDFCIQACVWGAHRSAFTLPESLT